jgi:hypothetical protein
MLSVETMVQVGVVMPSSQTQIEHAKVILRKDGSREIGVHRSAPVGDGTPWTLRQAVAPARGTVLLQVQSPTLR